MVAVAGHGGIVSHYFQREWVADKCFQSNILEAYGHAWCGFTTNDGVLNLDHGT
jgi:hypothetical protein